MARLPERVSRVASPQGLHAGLPLTSTAGLLTGPHVAPQPPLLNMVATDPAKIQGSHSSPPLRALGSPPGPAPAPRLSPPHQLCLHGVPAAPVRASGQLITDSSRSRQRRPYTPYGPAKSHPLPPLCCPPCSVPPGVLQFALTVWLLPLGWERQEAPGLTCALIHRAMPSK